MIHRGSWSLDVPNASRHHRQEWQFEHRHINNTASQPLNYVEHEQPVGLEWSQESWTTYSREARCCLTLLFFLHDDGQTNMHTDAGRLSAPRLRLESTVLRALTAGGAIGWRAWSGPLGKLSESESGQTLQGETRLGRSGPERRGPGFWRRIKLREREGRGRQGEGERKRAMEKVQTRRGERGRATQSGGEWEGNGQAAKQAGRQGGGQPGQPPSRQSI